MASLIVRSKMSRATAVLPNVLPPSVLLSHAFAGCRWIGVHVVCLGSLRYFVKVVGVCLLRPHNAYCTDHGLRSSFIYSCSFAFLVLVPG